MKRHFLYYIACFLAIIFLMLFWLADRVTDNLTAVYRQRESKILQDRFGQIIAVQPNPQSYYALYVPSVPENFKKYLLQKEDKFFYYHPGINPISTLRAAWYYLNKQPTASSTITQQLAKILLNTGDTRNAKNKIKETLCAFSLELYLPKETIITMYVNSMYLGNNVQGLQAASLLYFGAGPEALTDEQILNLVATINGPSVNNPFTFNNSERSQTLAQQFNIDYQAPSEIDIYTIEKREEAFTKLLHSENTFELDTLLDGGQPSGRLTIDQELTNNLRNIIKRNLESLYRAKATNAALVAIKLPENELLAIIGSPDPGLEDYGYKINMSVKPRPIGSTVKPFIYANGFAQGLRPYTLVEDKEYKYTIGSGFAFYPKNYDYEYRGEVSLHYALANSLNVPTVKVLEYVGLENFYDWLTKNLEFQSIQDIRNYELSIALGGLEMDLLTLSYYFTLFANNAELHPLHLVQNQNMTYQSQTNFSQNKKVLPWEYTQLVNKILSDRQTGIEQFGLISNLNLPQTNIAVKTGTSREFHDSWTVGYTPDFLVAVWVGNSDNTPMDEVAGANGAGRIWHEAMNVLINSDYNFKTEFPDIDVKEFNYGTTLEYGLAFDDYPVAKQLLLTNSLIIYPHAGDTFLLEPSTKIPLKASQEVDWKVNGAFLGRGQEIIFTPPAAGVYSLQAITINNKKEELKIKINEKVD